MKARRRMANETKIEYAIECDENEKWTINLEELLLRGEKRDEETAYLDSLVAINTAVLIAVTGSLTSEHQDADPLYAAKLWRKAKELAEEVLSEREDLTLRLRVMRRDFPRNPPNGVYFEVLRRDLAYTLSKTLKSIGEGFHSPKAPEILRILLDESLVGEMDVTYKARNYQRYILA